VRLILIRDLIYENSENNLVGLVGRHGFDLLGERADAFSTVSDSGWEQRQCPVWRLDCRAKPVGLRLVFYSRERFSADLNSCRQDKMI
jgi:hypothetical protein